MNPKSQARVTHALNASRSTSPVWLNISASVNSPVDGSPLLEKATTPA
jgi:hypothetical protein